MKITTRGIVAFAAATLLALGVATPAMATGGGGDQVCGPLSSGKIDTSGDPQTVTVTAPEGYLIDRYCVKAGSVQQGNGPEYVDVDPAAESVTFGHSSGKDVSHYSVHWVEKPVTPPPFDWNWQYAAPTCDALTVTYPDDIPAGQANDVNIRIGNLDNPGETMTLNFHNNSGTWSGTQTFVYADHASWPGWTHYEVQWTQVAGTNYHWEGSVTCGNAPPPPPEEPVYELTTSHVAECGTVSISLRNVSPWLYRVLIETETAPGVWERADGTVSGAGIYAAKGVLMVDNRGDAPDDQTGTYTVTFPEDSGTHAVRYKVSSGAEADLYVGLPVGEFTTVTVESDCEPNIPPKPEPLTGVDTRTSDPVCTEPLDGTATVVTEERTWTHHYRLVDGEWVLAPQRFETMWTVSGVETIDLDDCIPDKPKVKQGFDVRADAVCVTDPANGELLTTLEKRTWTQDWTWTGSKWVRDAKVYGEWKLVESISVPWPKCQPDPLTGIETRTGEPVCVEPLDGTATVTTEAREWSQDATWNWKKGWVYGEVVLTDWEVVEQTTVESEDCTPPVPPVTPEPPAETLATTGADLMPFGLAGLALLVAGGAALGVRKFARHL